MSCFGKAVENRLVRTVVDAMYYYKAVVVTDIMINLVFDFFLKWTMKLDICQLYLFSIYIFLFNIKL